VKDLLCDEFQNTVARHLVQNKSILDTISKMDETNARIHRVISRSVTQCGCIRVEARRQEVPNDASLAELGGRLDTHVRGELCSDCRERLETEVGSALFYLAAVCDLLGVSLYDCLLEESKRIRALGVFNLT
jgi:hypothetical protein